MKTQVNNHPLKKSPGIGACGLDCGLCPRFHSGGAKPCPGCCGKGFWEVMPGCAFINCCVKQRGLEVCGECNELEYCPRVMRNLETAKRRDSLLSYRTMPGNLESVRDKGLKATIKKLQDRVEFLRLLIREYNDGRSKGFYCLCVQLLPLDGLKQGLAETQKHTEPDMTAKDKTRLVRDEFGRLAQKLGIELKLRTGKPA